MGTINYKSNNDFLTFGYNCSRDYDNYLCEDCYLQAKWALENRHFDFYNVEVVPGYYEGFSIEIEFRILYFDNYVEKQAALKELTELKRYLEECINDYEIVVCYPGWGTSYEDRQTSLKSLKNAIKIERQRIKEMKTDKTLTIPEWKKLMGIA